MVAVTLGLFKAGFSDAADFLGAGDLRVVVAFFFGVSSLASVAGVDAVRARFLLLTSGSFSTSSSAFLLLDFLAGSLAAGLVAAFFVVVVFVSFTVIFVGAFVTVFAVVLDFTAGLVSLLTPFTTGVGSGLVVARELLRVEAAAAAAFFGGIVMV